MTGAQLKKLIIYMFVQPYMNPKNCMKTYPELTFQKHQDRRIQLCLAAGKNKDKDHMAKMRLLVHTTANDLITKTKNRTLIGASIVDMFPGIGLTTDLNGLVVSDQMIFIAIIRL